MRFLWIAAVALLIAIIAGVAMDDNPQHDKSDRLPITLEKGN